jgi:hypothetical protein
LPKVKNSHARIVLAGIRFMIHTTDHLFFSQGRE